MRPRAESGPCGCMPITDSAALYRLPNHLDASRQGRAFVMGHLRQAGIADPDVEAATVLASELVSNALRYAAPPLCLQVAVDEHRIRLEVHDSSADPPEMRRPSYNATSGRGLWLVDNIASRWGHRPLSPGKVVWAELSHTDQQSMS
jgi:anti-sigma regulatory factor (Ser/Thr protein kinase)